MERAVDEPQERRAREAAVVEGGVGGEGNLCLAESGAAGYGEEGAEGEEAGRGPVDGVGTERLAGAGGRVAAEELGEEVWAEWLSAEGEEGFGAVLFDEGDGEAVEDGAKLGAGDHVDAGATVDATDAADHGVGTFGFGSGVGFGAGLDDAIDPDEETAEEALFCEEGGEVGTGVGGAVGAPG